MRHIRKAMVIAVALAIAAFGAPLPASAANPGPLGYIAFIHSGNIYTVTPSGTAKAATTGGGYAWPKWDPRAFPDIAFIYKTNIWIGEMGLDGKIARETQLTFGGHVGAPSWSPDGSELAYVQSPNGFNETLFIARFGSAGDFAVGAKATARKLISVTSRQVGPTGVKPADGGAAWSTLSTSFNVAWSPNGEGIAFPGGDCLGVQDNCLSVVDLATNTEREVIGFSGGGNFVVGYATDPAWSADSKHLYWNQQTSDEDGLDPNTPLEVWESNSFGSTPVMVGHDYDSEPAPSPAADGSLLVAGGHNHQQWITKIAPNGSRTYLFLGDQPDWGNATTF
jgi:TolB protein